MKIFLHKTSKILPTPNLKLRRDTCIRDFSLLPRRPFLLCFQWDDLQHLDSIAGTPFALLIYLVGAGTAQVDVSAGHQDYLSPAVPADNAGLVLIQWPVNLNVSHYFGNNLFISFTLGNG